MIMFSKVLERKQKNAGNASSPNMKYEIKSETEDSNQDLWANISASSSPSQQSQNQHTHQQLELSQPCLAHPSLMLYNPAVTYPAVYPGLGPTNVSTSYDNVASSFTGHSFMSNSMFPSGSNGATPSDYLSLAFNMWRMQDGLDMIPPPSSVPSNAFFPGSH